MVEERSNKDNSSPSIILVDPNRFNAPKVKRCFTKNDTQVSLKLIIRVLYVGIKEILKAFHFYNN